MGTEKKNNRDHHKEMEWKIQQLSVLIFFFIIMLFCKDSRAEGSFVQERAITHAPAPQTKKKKRKETSKNDVLINISCLTLESQEELLIINIYAIPNYWSINSWFQHFL